MVNFEYLYKGLCGLARAHRASVMSGHLGAAVVAGYFFGEDHPDLDDHVHSSVEKELDRILHGDESFWYDAAKAGITIPELFEPFPEEPSQPDQIATIPKALAANIDRTRQSGHNVIFGSIAVRALSDHPEYATPSIISGIRKLIEGFDGAVPGRGYYGKARGWIEGHKVTLAEDDGFDPYESERKMADVVVDELIRTASMHRQGFGGLFHVINHAVGLTELARFGHRDLARRGFAAHRQHVRLWRSLPDLEDELGALHHADHDPRTPEYWKEKEASQWSAQLTHRIKTLYGFFTLLRFVEDPAHRRKAEEQFLYLMA